MAKTGFKSVDEYIATHPRGVQAVLQRVRSTYSLYPASAHLLAAFRDELAPYEVEKGTIRFPLSQPVPLKLIERIARFRAREAAERGKARPAGPKKPR
jgi:hypothetical protein